MYLLLILKMGFGAPRGAFKDLSQSFHFPSKYSQVSIYWVYEFISKVDKAIKSGSDIVIFTKSNKKN